MIDNVVPFGRCQPVHPPLISAEFNLIRAEDVEMNTEEDRYYRGSIDYGRRYSTLASGR